MDGKRNHAQSPYGTCSKSDQTQSTTGSQRANQNDVANPSLPGFDQSRGERPQNQWTDFTWATEQGGIIDEPNPAPPATPRLSNSEISRDRTAGSPSHASTQTPQAQPFVHSPWRRVAPPPGLGRPAQRPPSKLSQVMTNEDTLQNPSDSSTGK